MQLTAFSDDLRVIILQREILQPWIVPWNKHAIKIVEMLLEDCLL